MTKKSTKAFSIPALLLSILGPVTVGCASSIVYYVNEGNYEAVEREIEDGIDVDTTDFGGYTGLEAAVENADVTMVALLLEAGANVDVRSDGGTTPLMRAARLGSVDVVELLIEYGANVNAIRPTFYETSSWDLFMGEVRYYSYNPGTPLKTACYHDQYPVAVALIAAGADVNHRDEEGATPASISAENASIHRLDILKALAAAGALDAEAYLPATE